jgi:hypothetical protein
MVASQVADAIRLYNSSWSLAQVGGHLNVDPTTVLTNLRERGTHPRHPRTTATFDRTNCRRTVHARR